MDNQIICPECNATMEVLIEKHRLYKCPNCGIEQYTENLDPEAQFSKRASLPGFSKYVALLEDIAFTAKCISKARAKKWDNGDIESDYRTLQNELMALETCRSEMYVPLPGQA